MDNIRLTKEMFGERLKLIRRRSGMSQEEVANRLGITLKAEQEYEQGIKGPTTHMISCAGHVFGTKPFEEWMFASPEKRRDYIAQGVIRDGNDIQEIASETTRRILIRRLTDQARMSLWLRRKKSINPDTGIQFGYNKSEAEALKEYLSSSLDRGWRKRLDAAEEAYAKDPSDQNREEFTHAIAYPKDVFSYPTNTPSQPTAVETGPKCNWEKLSELLWIAKGSRPQNTFAKDCMLSVAYINKLLNKKKTTTIKPSTLKRLAEASEGRVTYLELLIAAGYVEEARKKSKPEEKGEHDPEEKHDQSFNKRLENIESALTRIADALEKLVNTNKTEDTDVSDKEYKN